jgi:hypothetical protein
MPFVLCCLITALRPLLFVGISMSAIHPLGELLQVSNSCDCNFAVAPKLLLSCKTRLYAVKITLPLAGDCSPLFGLFTPPACIAPGFMGNLTASSRPFSMFSALVYLVWRSKNVKFLWIYFQLQIERISHEN